MMADGAQQADGFKYARSDEDGAPVQAPHNLEAEQAILGALLVNNDVLLRVQPILQSEMFFEPVHSEIYEAICSMAEKGQIADPVKLKPFFENHPALEDVGGARYLVRLAASATTIINAPDYASTVRDEAVRRAAIAGAEQITEMAYNRQTLDKIDELINLSADVATWLHDTHKAGASKGTSIGAAVTEALDAVDRACDTDGLIGVTTGIDSLDDMIGGFQGGQLIIAAGRPKMGKTLLATNAARAAAVSQAGVGLFSLEMSRAQLAIRMITDMASFKLGYSIPYKRAIQGKISEKERGYLRQAKEHMMDLPIRIDDTKNLGADEFRMAAKRMQRDWANTGHPLKALFVDYLQLLKAGNRYRGNRVGEISEITRTLKVTAMELEIPVIVLSQLNRDLERRDNKRPVLSDLRESGSIEQDADVVMFVYREAVYLQQALDGMKSGTNEYYALENEIARLDSIMEIIIGAQRMGPTGTVKAHVDLAAGAIRSLHQPDIHKGQGDLLNG